MTPSFDVDLKVNPVIKIESSDAAPPLHEFVEKRTDPLLTHNRIHKEKEPRSKSQPDGGGRALAHTKHPMEYVLLPGSFCITETDQTATVDIL